MKVLNFRVDKFQFAVPAQAIFDSARVVLTFESDERPEKFQTPRLFKSHSIVFFDFTKESKLITL